MDVKLSRKICHCHQKEPQNSLYNIIKVVIVIVSLIRVPTTVMAECPNSCECKWKSGKESVLCLNANLTNIPDKLDSGTQILDLTGNEIAVIPNDVFATASLLNLQKVYLSKCRTRQIEPFAFRKLSNLVELDFSYNQLTMVPSHAFDSIPELRDIKLNGNPITRISNDAFSRIPQLVRLDLSDCKIQQVEPRAFFGLEASLEWLKLDGNRLVDIESETLNSLSNLHGLELARNQWNCSCQLRPIRLWMLRENIPYSIPPTCQTPERLAGKTWDRIDLDDFACTPNIQSVEIKTNGVEGKNVTMSCYVDGVPDPNVRWIVKNRIIANLSGNGETVARPSIMSSSSSSTTTSSQGRKAYVVNFIRNSSNLTILQVEMQDAGVYTCTAENKAGRVEASMTLAVSRKPPEAPLGVKIILLCVTIALLFVIGSSFAAVCFCTKRKKGKLKLWKSSSAPGSDSYEKIEMKRTKPDMHCGRRGIDNNSSSIGGAGAGEYLCTENGGIAVVNATTTASVVLKRNGDYRTVPTEDDEDNNDTTTSFSITQTHKKQKQKQHHHKIEYSKGDTRATTSLSSGGDLLAASKGRAGGAGNSLIDKNTDLHIGRLIDLGPSDVPLKPQTMAFSKSTWTSQLVTTTTTLENKYEQLKNDMNSSVFCSTIPPDNEQHKYPDLLDVYKSGGKSSSIPATSSGICTLPRKLKNTRKYFKNSTDSQSPLLADCSSKTGSSLLGDPNSLLDFSTNGRRFSAESYNNQPGYYAIRPNSQRCSSFLNLVQTAKPVVHRKNPSLPSSPVRESTATHQRSLSSAATPLLDFSSLITTRAGAAMQHSSKMNPYDYHAAQLERFLEEYRNLQEQLCKMKETCDSIRKKDAPLRGALGHSAQFADPIMFDAAINSNSLVNLDTHSNPKTVLKSKPILPGQPPDPPPYWLHRNTVLKRLNDAQNDYFKS